MSRNQMRRVNVMFEVFKMLVPRQKWNELYDALCTLVVMEDAYDVN